MLRAACSAPSMFIAELKRSAKIIRKYTWAQLGQNLGLGVGGSNYPKNCDWLLFQNFVSRSSRDGGRRPMQKSKPSLYRLQQVPRSGKFFKTIGSRLQKFFSNPRMKAKGDFEDCDCAARVEGRNLTEPNQSLQRMRKRCLLVESKDSGPHR